MPELIQWKQNSGTVALQFLRLIRKMVYALQIYRRPAAILSDKMCQLPLLVSRASGYLPLTASKILALSSLYFNNHGTNFCTLSAY